LEGGDGGLHDALEEGDVALVVDAVLKGDVEAEVLAQRVADLVDVTCEGTRESGRVQEEARSLPVPGKKSAEYLWNDTDMTRLEL
jgi:hypothetical protein